MAAQRRRVACWAAAALLAAAPLCSALSATASQALAGALAAEAEADRAARDAELAGEGLEDVADCQEASAYEHSLRSVPWRLQPEAQRRVWECLGYTEESWDDFERVAVRSQVWSALADDQRRALRELGYSPGWWNCGLAAAAPVPGHVGALHWKVKPRLFQGGTQLSLAGGGTALVLGVGPRARSAMLGAIAARLLAGMYGLHVTLRSTETPEEAYSQLHSGQLDLVLDHLSSVDAGGTGVVNYGAVSEVVNARRLYMLAAPPRAAPGSAAAWPTAIGNVSAQWTILHEPGMSKHVPRRQCTMGPWGGDGGGYGVWCMKPYPKVPVIWARGPFKKGSQPSELMAFLNARGLHFGIEVLESRELDRRLRAAAQAGAPAFAYLGEQSMAALSLRSRLVAVELPSARACGDLGTWRDVGYWHCTSRPRWWYKLGGPAVEANALVSKAIRNFKITDSQFLSLFDKYVSFYGESLDSLDAVDRAAAHFIQTEEGTWRSWFATPEPMSTDGMKVIMFIFAMGLVFAAIAEMYLLKRGKVPPPPDVMERLPMNVPLECMAGLCSTAQAVLDAVAVAGILLSTARVKAFQGTMIKHVLVGQVVAQITTLLCSNYETPLVTVCLEVVPFLAVVVRQIEQETHGRSGQCVLVTALVASSMVAFISGTLLYLIGLLRLGSLLRFLPFSVKVGLNGGLGILFFAVGLEQCSGQDVLEVTSVSSFLHFIDWGHSKYWWPALLSGIVLFLANRYTGSPYVMFTFVFFSIGGFHALLSVAGISQQDAITDNWLYSEVPPEPTSALWESIGEEYICWQALVNTLPTITITAMVASTLVTVADFALVHSILPQKAVGVSTFSEELIGQGRSHLLTGVAVGFCAEYSNCDTLVHRMLGGKRRLSMWVHVATMLACLACPFVTEILTYIPKFVNGGAIIFAGFELMFDSWVEHYKDMRTSEYAIVVIFALLVVGWHGGIAQAVCVATFLGFADFIIESANVAHVSFERLASSTVWGPRESFRLECCGLRGTIVSARLRGYIFFASAPQLVDQLLAQVRRLIGPGQLPHRKVLVVDWTGVVGLDSAAALEFERLTAELSEASVPCIFCGLSPKVDEALMLQGLLAEEREFVSECGSESSKPSCDEEGATTALAVEDLERALYVAEVLQLRAAGTADLQSAVRQAAVLALGDEPVMPGDRFRALAQALCGSVASARVLRGLVNRGHTRIVTLRRGASLAMPGSWADRLYVLLAGSVVATTRAHPKLFRHVRRGDVFLEEALTGAHCAIGYTAATSCILMEVPPSSLTVQERALVCQALVEQNVTCKGVISHTA